MLVMGAFLVTGLLLAALDFYQGSVNFPSVAFGQTAGGGFGNANIGPQDPSAIDAGNPGDPDVSNSTDIPPDASNNLGSPDLNDTVGGQDMSNPDAAVQIASPNATNAGSPTPSTQAVPEFGLLSGLILGISIVNALFMGQRSFFK